MTIHNQNLTLNLPPLTDEAAVSLKNFASALLYAVDEKYYLQIHQYHARQLEKIMKDSEFFAASDD